jgi:hypothetical protein
VIQRHPFSFQGRALETTDFKIAEKGGLNELLEEMQKKADAGGIDALGNALVDDLVDYAQEREPSLKWVGRETVAGVVSLLTRIGAATQALQTPPSPATAAATPPPTTPSVSVGSAKSGLQRRLQILKSKLGLLKAHSQHGALSTRAQALTSDFQPEAKGFDATSFEKSLAELETAVGGLGGDAKEVKASAMTLELAVAWAMKRDFSPAERDKKLSAGTLCNVEVRLESGAPKDVGSQTNAALGAVTHAEKQWWTNHNAKLLALVRQGCSIVVFHITRKPCGEGCDPWMRTTVYSAITGAAGGRKVFILVKTYKDDMDGTGHLYLVTPGSLLDK